MKFISGGSKGENWDNSTIYQENWHKADFLMMDGFVARNINQLQTLKGRGKV